MGSETSPRLPFIDFSDVDKKTNALNWDLTRSRVLQALEEFGCFEASFGDNSLELQTSIFDSVQQLFDIPLETKLKNQTVKPFHGYLGQSDAVPLYESMAIEDAQVPEKAENFTKMMWPEGNPEFCSTMHEYSEKLSILDQMVRTMVLESLGLEKYMVEHMGSTDYLLRLAKYKRPITNDSEIGIDTHTDKNMVTILHHDQFGLEVQTKSGDWIKIPPSAPKSFIVMLGDSFHAWSNGRLHSTKHRVVMSGEKDRYSLALFAKPRAGYMIKAPEEIVDEQHPLLFKPFDHCELLNFFLTEAGQQAQSLLKAYCGV